MDKKEIEEINKQIFNKLFFELDLFKQKEIEIENIGKVNHVYYARNHKIWFTLMENENKAFYIFGLNKSENIYELIIDFSKNYPYCDECIGILNNKSIYLHKDNLIKKFPNLNLQEYTIKNFLFLDSKNQNIECIEIGNIMDNFLDTIEKLILDIYHSKKISNSKKSKKQNEIEPREIVLKAMKRKKTRKEAAIIANIPLYKISHWYNEGRMVLVMKIKVFIKN